MSQRKEKLKRKLVSYNDNPVIKEPFSIIKRPLAIIICIGFLVFLNGLFNHFILDDPSQIVDNLNIHNVKNIPFFFTGGTFFNGGGAQIGAYYRPLVSTFFAIIYSFFGNNYVAFHSFQLIFHIANACILFLLFRSFFERRLSLVLSLIFLVHPLNSEAVYYISSTQDVLFFFFGISSLWLLVGTQYSKRNFTIALIFLLFSLFSKETGIMFILMDALYLFMKNRQKSYIFIGLSLIILIFYLFLKNNAVGLFTKSSAGLIGQVGLLTRLINIPATIIFYLRGFVYPLNLASVYEWVYKIPDLLHFWLPLFLFVLFISSVFYFMSVIYKKHSQEDFRTYIFFAFWFFIGIALHLNIFPLDATVAERWFYFPIVGLLGMIGILLKIYKVNFTNRYVVILTAIILIIFSVRTFVRSFDWRNELQIASHDIKVSKEAYNLENTIAIEFLRQGNFEEAKIYAEKSINIHPYTQNYNTLGLIYFWLNDYPKAKESYLKALTFGSRYKVYDNLAWLGLVYGDPKENIEFIKGTLKKFPQDYRLWLYLAILEYKQGDMGHAKAAIIMASRFDQSVETKTIFDNIMKGEPLNLGYTLGNKLIE